MALAKGLFGNTARRSHRPGLVRGHCGSGRGSGMLSACVRARVGVGVRLCVREGSPEVGATWGQSKGQDAWVWCLLGWSGLFQARTLSGGRGALPWGGEDRFRFPGGEPSGVHVYEMCGKPRLR